MARTARSEFSVELDRVEEGITVLLAPDGFQWHLPARHLPPDAVEGVTLSVVLETDQAAAAARMERIRRLREGLGGR